MNILSNFKVEEQYTIKNILENSLFELNEKKFYQRRSNWLFKKVLNEEHLKFVSLLVLLYDLAQNDFDGIYNQDKNEVRKYKVITLMKAYLHDDKYDEPQLVSNILNYMFEYDYFDKELLLLLKNKDISKYYDIEYLKSFFKKIKYKASVTVVNMPSLGIYEKTEISNNLFYAELK